MSTVFEMILGGQIPGKFIWKDDECFAILDINPVSAGHTLVIPREPIDKWTDLPDELRNHLFDVAAKIARAQEVAFDVPRCVVIIAGFEVPHAHIHVIPARSESAANLGNGTPLDEQAFEDTYERLTGTLVEQGFEEMVLRAGTPAEGDSDDIDI